MVFKFDEHLVHGAGEDSRRREDRPKPSNSENPPTKAHRQSNGAQADGKKLPKWMKLSKR
jgi:hypothetical protein